MNIVGYKCKICGWETTKNGWRNESLRMNDHFAKFHSSETMAIKESEDLVRNLTEEIQQKYLKTLSEYIVPMESQPQKLWKCPNCATKPMSYSSKLWHNNNFHNKILPKKMLGKNDEQP